MYIITIIFMILTFCFGGIALYFKSKSQLIEKIGEFIFIAEDFYSDLTSSGKDKFEFVVDSLYKLVPSIFQNILSKDVISVIVQNIFNHIENYATIQLDKVFDKIRE